MVLDIPVVFPTVAQSEAGAAGGGVAVFVEVVAAGMVDMTAGAVVEAGVKALLNALMSAGGLSGSGSERKTLEKRVIVRFSA